MTTRFPAGLSNAAPYSTYFNAPVIDETKFQQVTDDFAFFNSSAWTVVETQAAATQAGTAGAGGLLLLTNSAAIADVNAVTSPVAQFRLIAGKRFFAKCRMTVSDITNTTIFFGLGNAATTLAPANGIYITKTGTTVSINNANASTVTTASFTDPSGLTAGVYATFGIEYDGKSLNLYYGTEVVATPLAERKIASIDAPNLNTGVDLLAIVGIKNVNAVANTGTIDYVQFSQER